MPKRDESLQIGDDIPPEVLAQIEAQSTLKIDDLKARPELVKFAVDQAKKSGNDAFKSGRMRDAVRLYTSAIAGAPGDAALHGNRSAAKLALGEHEGALMDATRCVELDETWAKGHYRLGCALSCFGEWIAAAQSFRTADQLAPGSKDVKERLAVASALAAEETNRIIAQVESQRRDLAKRLRDARAVDAKEAIMSAWRQQNGGYEWEPEDYEWRPTYLPLMRSRRADKRRFIKDDRRNVALNFAAATAELDAPKRTLLALGDRARLDAYADAAVRVFKTVGDEPALVLANGAGGVLAMTAAAAVSLFLIPVWAIGLRRRVLFTGVHPRVRRRSIAVPLPHGQAVRQGEPTRGRFHRAHRPEARDVRGGTTGTGVVGCVSGWVSGGSEQKRKKRDETRQGGDHRHDGPRLPRVQPAELHRLRGRALGDARRGVRPGPRHRSRRAHLVANRARQRL
tara:strand:+ start:76 stop:1440 length:1365 start_codon:yes stop_codon:yes gene_type:complete